MPGPQISLLPDGRRLHMNHGPIDLIVEAFGEPTEVKAAYAQAAARFQTILTELVAELPDLRRRAGATVRAFAGSTALRMERAVVPLAEDASPPRATRKSEDTSAPSSTQRTGDNSAPDLPPRTVRFITPMAAVAGAVADEMLAAMTARRALSRAYVNDGGDIALHLAPGESLKLAIAGAGHGLADRIAIHHADPVRGIATSGWRGRSFSLGIADAVTVLARTAAAADAAATIIANAVDLPGHPAITRAPADTLQPDTDLGARLVTTAVGALTPDEIAQALSRGAAVAQDLADRGLIAGAALFLAGEARVVGIPGQLLMSAQTPSPVCFANHLSPTPLGRGTASMAADENAARPSATTRCVSSPPFHGGEVASAASR
ncbi:MAG: UPF0280 family protein [Mesorhizobium sp.]|nr:UPF0280 family protein [Mesorhizobium sp.]